MPVARVPLQSHRPGAGWQEARPRCGGCDRGGARAPGGLGCVLWAPRKATARLNARRSLGAALHLKALAVEREILPLRAACLTCWAFPTGQAALALPSTWRPCPETLALGLRAQARSCWRPCSRAHGGAAERVQSPEDGGRACRGRGSHLVIAGLDRPAGQRFLGSPVFTPILFFAQGCFPQRSMSKALGTGQEGAGKGWRTEEESWPVGTASGD